MFQFFYDDNVMKLEFWIFEGFTLLKLYLKLLVKTIEFSCVYRKRMAEAVGDILYKILRLAEKFYNLIIEENRNSISALTVAIKYHHY